MGDGSEQRKGHAPAAGRGAAAEQEGPAVGKVTRVQQCDENAPEMLARFRERPRTYLDDLLPPRDPAALKQQLAERAARDHELVIGELPLGGWLVGRRKDFDQIARHEQTQITLRTIDATRSTVAGTVATTIATALGNSPTVVMRKAEAAAAIEGIVTAIGKAAKNQPPPRSDRETARDAPLEQAAHRSTAPAPNAPTRNAPAPSPAPTPAKPTPAVSPPDPEHQRLTLGRPARGPQTPIGPGTRVPRSQRVARDRSLVDELKLRSVPTKLDGTEHDDDIKFDPFTPSFIAGHFKSEQRRTGSDNPRDWRNPPGYAAQHPNGRPYALYGEPPGTRLTWGTVEDNRDLQKPRELGQTPSLPDRGKPLP